MVADPLGGGDVSVYRNSSIAPLPPPPPTPPTHPIRVVSPRLYLDVLDGVIRTGVSLFRSMEQIVQWEVFSGLVLFALGGGGGLGHFHGVVEGLHCRVSDFLHRVVVHRRDEAFPAWRSWLLEDLLVHPCQWLRPDLVLPAPFFQCEPHVTPGGSGVLAHPAGIDEEFRKALLLLFCRSGQREPIWRNSMRKWGAGCPLLHETSLPPLTGEDLAGVVRRISATACLFGWLVMEGNEGLSSPLV